MRCALGRSLASVALGLVASANAGIARAQSQTPPSSGTPPIYGAAPYRPAATEAASDLEIGTLYGFSAAYGVGVGIWLDAELSIDDPGLKFIAPAILGVAAPAGGFFLDRPRMPRGMPVAIAAVMAIGAGSGVALTGSQ